MAADDDDRIRKLWTGGSFPEENEYQDVQKKRVPKQEEVALAGQFEAAYDHLEPRLRNRQKQVWELEEMTVGDIVHDLQELNPLPVKHDEHGYAHVCPLDTILWDVEWRPGYGR